MKPIRRTLLIGVFALAVTGLDSIPASAAIFTVNSTADTADSTVGDGFCDAGGVCTLRAAIQEANTNEDQDTIVFAELLSNTIQPATALDNIIRSVIIIGTEPDGDRIELDGSLAGPTANGFNLSTADTSTIRGFVINRFGVDGINLGSTATENLIENNYIGTDITGLLDQGNLGNGLDILGHTNTVGGASSGNVISGNQGSGVAIRGAASDNSVEGNFIGTDVAGMAPLQNTNHGVVLDSLAHDNFVGGTTAAARNIISGNAQDGVRIQGGTGTTGNLILGNFIGTSVNGTDPLPNSQDGVGFRTSASGNTVGGTGTGAGNVISGNTDDGIQVGSPADPTPIGNGLLRNSIFENGALGIDLDPTNGLTLNDLSDVDTGPNNLQNFPELSSAASSATTTTISGTLNSQPGTIYRLEFFSNTACDSSGNGEGQTFLGTTNVTTDSSGNVNFTASSLTGGVAGQVATATATDPNDNTSEFSACTPVAVDTTPPVTVTPDTTPPTTPTTNAGGKFQKQRTFSVTWSTSTDTTGPVRYDVRYREAPHNGGLGGFVNWQSTTTATSATFTGAPGTTYCFSARAIDGAGNASPFGTEGCTAVPVDNPTFKHRGKWAKKTGAGYYLDTFSRTKQKGARLTLAAVQAKALSVIVTKCRSCGIIKVFFRGKLLKKVNLRSKAAARQKLRFVNLNPFTSAQTGTVKITVVSTGKLVIVEGLGVSAV